MVGLVIRELAGRGQPGKPVADGKEIFVIGPARRTGPHMPPEPGAPILVQGIDDARADVTAPPGACLVHDWLPCLHGRRPGARGAAAGSRQ